MWSGGLDGEWRCQTHSHGGLKPREHVRSPVLLFSLYPGESDIQVGLSAPETEPSTQIGNTTRLRSVVSTLPTQQLARPYRSETRP